jgi:histone deacetylase complex regulatory component SIN3
MKKIITLTFTLIAYISAFSQISSIELKKSTQVGKVAVPGLTLMSLSYVVDEKDTTYTLEYRNGEFTTLDSYNRIEFLSVGNTLNILYDEIMKAFQSEDIKKYEKSFILGNCMFTIRGTKFFGVKGVYLFSTDSKSKKNSGFANAINEGQVKRLFGKE